MLTANVTDKVYLSRTARASVYLRWLRAMPCFAAGDEVRYMWAKLTECTQAARNFGICR